MSNQLVLYEVVNNIAILTLNHPEKRNALSEALLLEMKARLEEANQDRDVRVVIIRANGKVFSSGHDLRELMDRDEESYARVFAICTEVMEAIRLLPKPVIAQVQGLATAAGCQLVATCDLAVASRTAKFCTPGVNIGLFCSTPMVALSRNVSRKRAMEMLLLGEMIGAEAAADYGLVNRVVDPGMLMDEAMAMAQAIAAKSSATVAIGKEAFYRQIEMPLVEAYDYASGVMVENMLLCDAEEGIGAFIEKRAPHWKDR
jgi:enoyl-CoA hydratase/carnithine racemase